MMGMQPTFSQYDEMNRNTESQKAERVRYQRFLVDWPIDSKEYTV